MPLPHQSFNGRHEHAIFAKAYLDAEMDRFLRPDAYHWLRPDWRRYVQRGSDLEKLYERIERKYRPDQARVPVGTPDRPVASRSFNIDWTTAAAIWAV